ncbi:hypothetical protein ACFLUS_04845, partial [Chloroflexota bacterium]
MSLAHRPTGRWLVTHSKFYSITLTPVCQRLRPKPKRKRKQTYDGQVTTPLDKVWEIFDCPCGQRLKP